MPDLATRNSGSCASTAFEPTALAPGNARAFVRDALSVRDIDSDAIWDACLIASELTTNAVTHVRDAREIRLFVSIRQRRPLIEVWDPSVEPPRLVDDPTGESGRGLKEVVARLAAEWSYTIYPPDGGKIVSAYL